MAERRTPTDPKGMREEVGSLAKKDPRRESTGPSLFIGMLQEVQRDIQALKERVTDLETALAEERQSRLVAETQLAAVHSRATKHNLRAASTKPPPPPPPRASTKPPPAKK